MNLRQVDESIVRSVLTRVPPSWNLIQTREDGAAFRRGSIQAIVSVSYEDDNQVWIHASICGRTSGTKYHLPTWDDMKRAKNDLIGADRWAYVVFPSEDQYVNINPYVLHLFSPLDGKPVLPDFTGGLRSL